jgi:hypothetical protein
MFENREIEVGYSRTINVGNYNSERIHVGFKASIKDDQPIEKVYDEAFKIVEDTMSNELKELKINVQHNIT